MRSFNLSTLATAAFATTILLFQPHLARAGGEGFSKDDLGGGKEMVDTKSSQEVSLGKFQSNPFHISVSVRGGYDDNVNLSSFDETGSGFVNVAGQLDYIFGSPRTQLRLTINGGLTYYFDRGDNSGDDNENYDVNASIAFAITHKATPRLTLGANVYASYQSQPSFDTFNNGGLGFGRTNQDFFFSVNKFSVTYAWAPRFATLTSYTLGIVNYDSDVISEFEDRFEHTFGNEFRFLLTPTTTLVGEYRYGVVDYTETDSRGSMSHFFLAGFDHSFSPRFNISGRGGVEFRQFDDNVPEGDRTAPYAEFTLNYALAKSSSITWTNRYSLEEPDVPDAFSRTTFRTALGVRHALTQRIVAGLNFAYEHDWNEDALGFSGFDEDDFDIALTLRYAINRTWSLEAGYEHTEVISDDNVFREFTRNRVWGGATFTW